MNFPLDGPLDRVGLQMIDLWPEWGYWLAVLGALSGIMSGLPTIEAGIVALTFFAHRAGHDVLDLSSSLVNILLPIWFVLNLSLLPSTSLLHWLSVLLRLKFALVIIISGPILVHELVFPFCDEGFVEFGSPGNQTY